MLPTHEHATPSIVGGASATSRLGTILSNGHWWIANIFASGRGFGGEPPASARYANGVNASMKKKLGSLDGYLHAQSFQSLDGAADGCLLAALIEVIGTKVLIFGSILQHVIGNHQDRVRDGDQCPLGTLAGGQPMVLGSQVGVSGVAGRPCCLHQDGSQMGVPLPNAGTGPFPTTLVQTGTEMSPTRQMAGRRKPAHVGPDGGHDLLGGADPHTGNGIQTGKLSREREKLLAICSSRAAIARPGR